MDIDQIAKRAEEVAAGIDSLLLEYKRDSTRANTTINKINEEINRFYLSHIPIDSENMDDAGQAAVEALQKIQAMILAHKI